MTDYYKLYNYPQSSCPCEKCPEGPVENVNLPYPKNVIQSSLSLNNCETQDLYTCTDTRTTRETNEPTLPEPDKITILNPDFGLFYAKDFQEENCQDNYCPRVFATRDPRLIDQARSQMLSLDRPVYTGVDANPVLMENLYDNANNAFAAKPYKTYSDINSGDYRYFVDKQLADAFPTPLFEIESAVQDQVYIDPMGGVKPQYTKRPLTINNRNISDYQFDRDEIAFREDIMSSQMTKMNYRDWNKAWGHNLN